MSNIEEKYRRGRLNKTELLQLREQVNGSSDVELGTVMEAHWQEGIDTSRVDDTTIDTIQERLDGQINGSQTLHRRLWRVLEKVAVVLLPICLLGLGYLGYERQQAVNDLLTISTRQGEQTNIIFPDSTRVQVNEHSIMTYHPKAFSHEHREIDFRGEGYFEVYHDSCHPFVIYTPDMSVKVTGTKFNLTNYPQSTTVTLCLFEGSVVLRSMKTQEQVTVNPHERCTLNKRTGRFSVTPLDQDTAYYTAWRRHELVFRSVPLQQVVQKLSAIYGVEIELENVNTSDRFTGTLPSSDFNKCMVVISNLYHCKVSRTDKAVVLTR
uniref:DUF4974 domain-containing protein n=1 Tax=Prevotella sp. GTC17260 TaxID=3236796 RepID=A0AB33JGR4_9BACT